MRCRDLTVMTQPQGQHGQCSGTSLRSRAVLRSTEVMCIVHITPMHYGMVIALKQSSRVDLIWCDSLQRDGQQALYTQYYHFLETEMNRPPVFQPTWHYSSDLIMRMHNLKLSRQHNGTDCGVFILLYQQTASRWYGITAGQEFTNGHIQDLISSFGTIDQGAASEHRRWLRNHMHTWWTGIWNGADPSTPPRVHQQNLHRRRTRRREREMHQSAIDSSDEETDAPAAIQIRRSPTSRT
jgi:hypothetical protein